MNLQRLKMNVGWLVQLVPVASRLDENGREREGENDDWRIEVVTDSTVDLFNTRTGHIAQLGTDHIHHFASNPGRAAGGVEYGFLVLNVQIFIQGKSLWVWPNARPGEPVTPEHDSAMAGTLRSRLLDERFRMIAEDYRTRGEPRTMIEAFPDLSQVEKAELYDRAVRWKKGHPPKRNPYK